MSTTLKKQDKLENQLEISPELQRQFNNTIEKLHTQFEQAFNSLAQLYEQKLNAFIQATFDTLENKNPRVQRTQLDHLFNSSTAIALRVLTEIITAEKVPTPQRATLAKFLLDKCTQLYPEHFQILSAGEQAVLNQRALKAKEQAELSAAKNVRMQHAEIEAAKLNLPRKHYLDDEDLKYYTTHAPNDTALELLALAYTHRDITKLYDCGYDKLIVPRKGEDATYALNHVQALLKGEAQFQHVLTPRQFTNENLQVTEAGQWRTKET